MFFLILVSVYIPLGEQPDTLLTLEEQRLGGNAMLVDAEHAFDPAYSKSLGVDVENLIVCQPDNGEMALESNFSSLLTFQVVNFNFRIGGPFVKLLLFGIICISESFWLMC